MQNNIIYLKNLLQYKIIFKNSIKEEIKVQGFVVQIDFYFGFMLKNKMFFQIYKG